MDDADFAEIDGRLSRAARHMRRVEQSLRHISEEHEQLHETFMASQRATNELLERLGPITEKLHGTPEGAQLFAALDVFQLRMEGVVLQMVRGLNLPATRDPL